MRDLLDRQLARLERQRRVQRTMDAVLPAAAVSLGVVAVVALVVRLAAPEAVAVLPAVILAGVLAPLVRIPAGWRPRDRPSDLAGHLDLLTDGRGLAMALAETDQRDDGWLERLRIPLETFQPPAVTWGRGRGALIALIAVALTLALPQQHGRIASIVDPVAALFASTEGTLDALADLGALPPERIAEHRQRLDELRAHAERHGMDQATWEAKDRLEQRLRAEAGLSSRRLAEALAQAEFATQGDPSAQQAAAEAMAQRLGELAARAPGLVPPIAPGDAQALSAAIAAAAAKGLLTPEQAAALERLGFRPGAPDGAALDPGQQRELAERLREALDERARALGTCDACEGFGDALAEARRTLGGGVDRGPGAADHPYLPTDRFAVGALDDLPPGARVNPDGSVTLAEQIRDPEVAAETAELAARAAARAFDPAAADARRSELAPRHRAVVGRYFATESTTPP